MTRTINEQEVEEALTMERAVEAIETAMRAKAEGKLVAPPRFSVDTEEGSLIFTAGAELRSTHTIGFRVYETLGGGSPETQMIAVFDTQTGALKGLVFGRFTGAMRTAAINAVATKYLARADVKRLGILGSGYHARFQARAAAAVRTFETAKVFSPTAKHRETFAGEMSAELGFPVNASANAEDVVRGADVLLCATRSTRPVFEAEWLRAGTHINSIGPKLKRGHEVPFEAAARSQVIATDSLEQVDAFNTFFLAGRPERARIAELSDIVTGKREGRVNQDAITLFCSVGLAGTEVVLANEVLKLVGN